MARTAKRNTKELLPGCESCEQARAPARIGNTGRNQNTGRKTPRVRLKKSAGFGLRIKIYNGRFFIPIVFSRSHSILSSSWLHLHSGSHLHSHPHPHLTLNMSGGVTLTVISYVGTVIAFLFSTLSLGNKNSPCMSLPPGGISFHHVLMSFFVACSLRIILLGRARRGVHSSDKASYQRPDPGNNSVLLFLSLHRLRDRQTDRPNSLTKTIVFRDSICA